MKAQLLIGLFILVLQCYALCNFKKIVDLTWNFDNDSVAWPGVQPFEYTKRVENEERGYWYAGGEFRSGEHVGTHMDAPYHFYKYGWKVGNIPVERLIAKGALLDLHNETNSNGETGNINLEVQHLEKWERQNGPFEKGTVLLIKFGRSQHWLNITKYFEMDREKNLNFPGVSKGAAEWLANSGKFYGVGLDTPSIDPGKSTDFMAHRILNGKQMYVLENVKLIDELPNREFTLLVMPMKLREGSGGPVRVIALPKKVFDD
ncbi:uncharacterized protein LOC108908558 [Anoplophora glabripennis]|uniref:uncharacterized protein LOC108908558 n=1 Tax=Anoplophora glabripennis TaxID=217634 RepID=UPI000873792E|nr:uncharacterized protein LOC108908558 [Anoplophora glabripennis]